MLPLAESYFGLGRDLFHFRARWISISAEIIVDGGSMVTLSGSFIGVKWLYVGVGMFLLSVGWRLLDFVLWRERRVRV